VELVNLPARIQCQELDAGLPEWDRHTLGSIVQRIGSLEELAVELVGEGFEPQRILLGVRQQNDIATIYTFVTFEGIGLLIPIKGLAQVAGIVIAGHKDAPLGRQVERVRQLTHELEGLLKTLRATFVREVAGDHHIIELIETQAAIPLFDVIQEPLQPRRYWRRRGEVKITQMQQADRLGK
jgi:hypothetical protein